MRKHIFLTGPKQVGKSTIIQKYLAAHSITCAGFLTVKSETIFPGYRSVHMLDVSNTSNKNAQNNKKPSKENFLFFCAQVSDARYRQYGLSPDPAPRFNRIGCQLLDAIPSDTELIIMDEIGPHEDKAFDFQKTILSYLERDIPIIGVLQQSDSILFHKIVSHPNVSLINVSLENRSQLELFDLK